MRILLTIFLMLGVLEDLSGEEDEQYSKRSVFTMIPKKNTDIEKTHLDLHQQVNSRKSWELNERRKCVKKLLDRTVSMLYSRQEKRSTGLLCNIWFSSGARSVSLIPHFYIG